MQPAPGRYIVLTGLCAAAALAYMQRSIVGPLQETMGLDLGLDANRMGDAMASFFITYALLQSPTGLASTRWSIRWSLAFYVAVFSLSAAAMGLAQGLLTFAAARLAMGIGQAGLFPCSTTSIARWFTPHERAIANGFIGGSMFVGTTLVSLIVFALIDIWSWQAIVVLCAVPGLVWTAWFAWWYRDWPAERAAASRAPTSQPPGSAPRADNEPTPWKALLGSPTMAFICGQHFFRGAASVFFASWFATYLGHAHGVQIKSAAGLNSLPPLGILLGSVLGGYISDGILRRTGSRRLARQGLAVASTLGCGILVLAAYFTTSVPLAVAVISLGSFIAAFAGPCAYTVSIDMGGKHVTQVFSIMNMAGNVGAGVFAYIAPRLADWTGSWDATLFLFAGMYIGAGICWLPIDPDRELFDAKKTRVAGGSPA